MEVCEYIDFYNRHSELNCTLKCTVLCREVMQIRIEYDDGVFGCVHALNLSRRNRTAKIQILPRETAKIQVLPREINIAGFVCVTDVTPTAGPRGI